MNDVTAPTTHPLEAAKAVIQEARQKRVDACRAELAEVLKKYRCDLIPRVTFVPNQPTEMTVSIVPTE